MIQHNINAYHPASFKQHFQTTELYKKLENDYDKVYFENMIDESNHCATPREQWGKSHFSLVPFYYLEYLTKQNPKEIVDLGCGWNIFKKYIPNIIGIGAEDNPEQFFGDVHDYVDDNFITNHQNYFESVFSINALHFIPLSNIKNRVINFVSMIKPGGYGFLTLNMQRMIERDEVFKNQPIANIEQYVRTELFGITDYKVFDVDLSMIDQPMDGNIRIVCHKIT